MLTPIPVPVPAAARMRGHTLSELVIASALGLFILSGMSFLYAEISQAGRRVLAETHLHQTLAAVVSAMTGELRRAGYWSRARDALDGAATNGYAPVNVAGEGCVLYSYDREHAGTDGRPREGDQFGLRLAGGTVQIKTSDAQCGDATCTRCDTGTWWAMTDPQSVIITGLSFRQEEHAQALDGDARIAVRNIEVVLSGALRKDPAVERTLTALVNVRNDEIR